jgi:hypothetical protein
MTINQIIRYSAVLALGVSALSNTTWAGTDADECNFKISGLHSVYSAGSRSTIVVENRSKSDAYVNIALEGMQHGSWIEVAGSISDPRRSFSKVHRMKLVKLGQSYSFAFSPCETPMMIWNENSAKLVDRPCSRDIKTNVSTALRLRLDIWHKGADNNVECKQSEVFRLSSRASGLGYENEKK